MIVWSHLVHTYEWLYRATARILSSTAASRGVTELRRTMGFDVNDSEGFIAIYTGS